MEDEDAKKVKPINYKVFPSLIQHLFIGFKKQCKIKLPTLLKNHGNVKGNSRLGFGPETCLFP